MKQAETKHYARDPLGEAAKWISNSGQRALVSWTWLGVKFNNFDGVCGINGTLVGNITVQMRYDWDETKGFHVNATKGNDVRAYILVEPPNPAGKMSNVGSDRYIRALKFLNNRRNGLGDGAALDFFMSGRI